MHPNITIGPFVLSSWFTMLYLGAVISLSLAVILRPKDFVLTRFEIFYLSVFLILAGLFGARVLFVILNFGVSGVTPANIFSKDGGFAYYGALTAIVGSLILYAQIRRKNIFAVLDYFIAFIMLSQAFVRIGCFMAGCCFGKPTGLSIGFVFKLVDNTPRHPTQVYEAVLLAVLYFVSRIVYKGNVRKSGHTFFITLMFYGLGRFFIEFFRTDSQILFLNLTLAEISSLGLAAAALMFFKMSKNKNL